MTERQPGRESNRVCVCVCLCVWHVHYGFNKRAFALGGPTLVSGRRALWDWTNQEVINYTPPSFIRQSKLTGWREEMQRGAHMLLPPQSLNTHRHTYSPPVVRQDTAARGHTAPHFAETHIHSAIIHSMPFSSCSFLWIVQQQSRADALHRLKEYTSRQRTH